MRIIHGKHAGETGRLHQFANDWMTAWEFPTAVFSPTSVELTPDEVIAVRAADPAHLGMFWTMWNLDDETGRFTMDPVWQGFTARRPPRVNARREGL